MPGGGGGGESRGVPLYRSSALPCRRCTKGRRTALATLSGHWLAQSQDLRESGKPAAVRSTPAWLSAMFSWRAGEPMEAPTTELLTKDDAWKREMRDARRGIFPPCALE